MVGDVPAGGLAAAGLLALVVLPVVLAAAVLRVIPEGERLVVSRLGGAPRVLGPGRVPVVPGVDRWVRVPLEPEPLDVWLEAPTRDGVALRLKAVALVSVSDPARYALRTGAPSAPPSSMAISVIVESRLRRFVAERDLLELAGPATGGTVPPAADVGAAVGEWGLTVSLLEIVRADVPLHALHRWVADHGPKPGPVVDEHVADGRVAGAPVAGHIPAP